MIRDPELPLEAATANPVLPSKYWFPLLVALVVSAAIFAVSEYSYRSFGETRGELAHAMALQAKLLELHGLVAAAESGQRGYLLTRSADYLEPYLRSALAIAPVREQLRDLTAWEKEERDRAARLDDLVMLKLSELQRTVEQARAGDFDGALSTLAAGPGRELMARIDSNVHDFSRFAAQRLSERAIRWEDSIDASRSGILAVVGLNTALIALLALVLIRDTRRARENAQILASFAERMRREVSERTAQLSSLSEFLQTQAESERARLAGELHDELSGILTPALMDVSWLEGRAGADAEMRRRLTRLSALLDSGIDVKRRIIENLRPSTLDHLGLAPALKAHLEEACKDSGLECRFTPEGIVDRLPPDVEIALYRIVQESAANAVRHARARSLDVKLDRVSDGVVVTVRDDGVGMSDVDAAMRNNYGMQSMRQRAHAIGGRLDIFSSPGGGTRVRAFAPL